ncbi:MAG: polysaccharide deacetylase family protein [Candidatus Coatesbacteria bacterium]|nr:polysaccharide deacetylase family protein [Candidatus Coatesbacteria bacterium]
MQARVPVFMFHHVEADDASTHRSALFVSQSKLHEIADWFLERGFESISVKRLAECLDGGDTASLNRKFVFTFDDGARNNFEYAYPLLSSIGCTATFYVPTDYIGMSSDWRKKKNRSFEIMGEDEILALSRDGFEIGSHGCKHTDLTALAFAELNRQMLDSKAVLSGLIGSDVVTFAYPYGLFDARVVECAKQAGYSAACSTIRGATQDSKHAFILKRIMVTEGTGSIRLRYFMSGLLDFEYRKEFRAAVSG